MKKIYFISKSEKKAQEVADFLKGTVEVEFRKEELPKIQSAKIKKLVKKKAKEAYKIVRRPVLVEHTSFCIDAFHELKGLDTNYFSSVMGYDNIIGYCEYKNNFRAYVESVFCLCNGKDYFIARAKDKGEIRHSSENVKNLNKGFGWDTIFVPNESNPNRKTYEELKREDKDRPTMRRKALKKLKDECAFQEKGLEWDKVYEDQEADLDQLAQLIFEGKVMLFAGAGLSASLGFPTWDALIGELGENAGYKKRLFKCHGNYMMLAEYARMMENKDTGKGAYEIMGDMLKISKEMESKLTKPKVSVIYQKLLELNFPVIYTTNYDHILEEFYRKNNRKCQVMYPQTEIADACAGCQDTRIMKFHGDVDALTHKDEHADSIVLSESQYFERMDFQSDMDQQFLRDMKEYHVLFLGYSLSDINVKMLMYLARKLRRDGEEPLKAYIYTATPNLIQREVFLKSGIVSFAGEVLDKKKGTEDFLDKLLNRIDELKAEGK